MEKLPDNLKIIKVAAVSFNEERVLESVQDKTSDITKDMAEFLKYQQSSSANTQKKEIEYITEIDIELAKMRAFFNSGYFEQLNEIYSSEYYQAIKDIMSIHYYFSDEYAKVIEGLNQDLLSGIIGLRRVIGMRKSSFTSVLRNISEIAAKIRIMQRQAGSLLGLIEPYQNQRSDVLEIGRASCRERV